MTKLINWFLVFLLLSTPVQAETLSCPGKVDHVRIEGDHYVPYPYMMAPNISDHPPRWDFSDRNPKDIVITVHCYPNKDPQVETDFVIPTNINFCELVNHSFTCK